MAHHAPKNAGQKALVKIPIAQHGSNRRATTPALHTSAHVLTLQRAIGNQRTSQIIQAKLTVGAAHDPLEQEADRVAEQVVNRSAAIVQRDASESDELQTRRDDVMDSFDAGGDFESKLGASGSGAPLDGNTRAQMEAGIGADFGNVRVHTGDHASLLNRSISARAFTRGSDVFFDRGQYNPGSVAGKRLLAHELTHVVQQGAAAQGAQRKAYPSAGVMRKLPPSIQRKLYVGGQEMEDADNDMMEVVDRQQGNVDTSNPEYRQIEGGTQVTSVDVAWKNVLAADPSIKDMGWWAKRSMKARLKKWIDRDDMLDLRGAKIVNALFKKSDERRYESWADVATALAGEQKAKSRKSKEKDLAKTVAKKNSFRRDLGAAMKRIHDWIDTRANANEWWDAIENYKAKFPRWYPRGQVKARMANPVLKRVSSNFVIIHEVMFALAKSGRVNVFAEAKKANKQKLGTVSPKGQQKATGKIGAGSGEAQGRHAVIEKNAWVKAARSRNMPLGAGASNTTHLLMTFSGMLNLSATDKKAIAWGAFVFWNKTFYQTEAVRHTFHEIMDVASLATGGEVDYDPDAANPYEAGYNKQGGNPLTVQQVGNDIPVNGEDVTEEQSQQIELPDNAPQDVLPVLQSSPEGKKEVQQDDTETEDEFGGIPVTLKLDSGKTLSIRDQFGDFVTAAPGNGATLLVLDPNWPKVPDFQNVAVQFGNKFGVVYADALKAAVNGSAGTTQQTPPQNNALVNQPIVDQSESSSQSDVEIEARGIYTLNAPIEIGSGKTWLDAGIQIMVVSVDEDQARVDANTQQIGRGVPATKFVDTSALRKALAG